MTPSAILSLVVTYGPGVLDLVAKLNALRTAGDNPLTDADFADLQRLASRTAADYLRESTPAAPANKNP